MNDNPIGEIIEAGTTAFVAQCLEVPRQIVPRLYDPPPFGSFVKIVAGRNGSSEAPPAPNNGATAPDGGAGEERGVADEEDPFASTSLASYQAAPTSGSGLPAATYALVYGANTASLETGRRPSALGFADEDELRARQPQIFELLRTEFSGLLIAYSEGADKGLRRHLPPKPPRIHSRVLPCDADEVRLLTQDLGFLRGVLLPSGGALAGVPSDELAAACLRQAREAQLNDRDFLLKAGKALATLLAEDYDRLQAILRNVL
ncbi:MAG: hypothetical protein M3Y28_08720 [Armatimonadota bacterium]|nr:hypothetical protein [Armatimonadota bacterium]